MHVQRPQNLEASRASIRLCQVLVIFSQVCMCMDEQLLA